MLSVIAEPIC